VEGQEKSTKQLVIVGYPDRDSNYIISSENLERYRYVNCPVEGSQKCELGLSSVVNVLGPESDISSLSDDCPGLSARVNELRQGWQ
jgi:hypothetical protein